MCWRCVWWHSRQEPDPEERFLEAELVERIVSLFTNPHKQHR